MVTFNGMIINTNSNECQSVEAMAKNAAKIAFYNFKWQFVTLVLFNVTALCGVNEFLRSYNKNAVVATDVFEPRFSERTRQFVIFGTNLDNISHILKWMEKRNFDNTAEYTVVCQSNKRNDCDEVNTLDDLWQRRIMNVIFINDVSNNGTAGYYYEYGEKCKNTPPIRVSNWESCVGTNASRYCARKFPVPFHNMYGCDIIVSTFRQPPYMYINDGEPSGADGDLLKIIIKALNATLVLMTPSRGDGWGNLDSNGTWVGSLGDLYYELANLSMTSASITPARYSCFELSNFYYTTQLIWVTHPPTPEASHYKLLRPFKPDTRIALALSLLFVVILAVLFKTNFCRSISLIINSGRLPESVIFLSWQMCMGQAITIPPVKMTVLYLILVWIWYCFLMRTFYQVHLMNSLKTEVYSEELSSIEDAIAADYPYGGGPALREYYIDNPMIYDNWQGRESSDYPIIMLNLTHGMKYVLAANVAAVKDFLKLPGRKLHILPHQIVNSPIGIFMKRFSPFISIINRKLERLFEFGIPQKIFKNNTKARTVYKLQDENKPIKLIYCTGCYIILFIGWVSSFAVFIIELLLERQRHPVITFRN